MELWYGVVVWYVQWLDFYLGLEEGVEVFFVVMVFDYVVQFWCEVGVFVEQGVVVDVVVLFLDQFVVYYCGVYCGFVGVFGQGFFGVVGQGQEQQDEEYIFVEIDVFGYVFGKGFGYVVFWNGWCGDFRKWWW